MPIPNTKPPTPTRQTPTPKYPEMTPQEIVECAARQKAICGMVSEDLGLHAYWMTIRLLALNASRSKGTP